MKHCGKCNEGWIVEKGVIKGRCDCVLAHAVHVAYHKFAEGDPSLFHTFEELEGDPLVENQKTQKRLTYKQFGESIVEHFDQLAKDHAKLYLYGDPENGKSQFVSSVLKEIAQKEQLGYYLPAATFSQAVFDYSDRERMKKIEERIKHPKTRLLIIDDMGSEVPKVDNRSFELATKYNELIRDFQRYHHEGCLIMMTSNFDKEQLEKLYSNDKRLFSVVFQENTTRYFKFSSKPKFRQNKQAESLSLFD